MFKFLSATEKPVVNNVQTKQIEGTTDKDSQLYTELTLKKDALAAYLPLGYFILIDGAHLVVYDEKGVIVNPKQESRLLRQDNKVMDNVVYVGKEIHVVESSEDNVTKLLSDGFAKDTMAVLPESIKQAFKNTPEVLNKNVEILKDYLKEQDDFRTLITSSFQLSGANDFLLKDTENFKDINLNLDKSDLSYLSESKTTSNYTLLVMVESIDTEKFQVIKKRFNYTELIVFKGFNFEESHNFNVRLQLVSHTGEEFKVDNKESDLNFILNNPEFKVKDNVLSITN